MLCSQLEEVLQDSKRHTSNTAVLLTGDFNMDVSQGPTAGAITRAQFQDAFAKDHEPTTLGHFWSTDGSLIGFLRVVVFAASNLLFTVRFRLPTIIRYPSMWLLSSAIEVPRPFAVPRSRPRRYRQISARKASYRILASIAERPEFLLSVENKTHS